MKNESTTDLDKLVFMAEDVSETVTSLQTMLSSLRVMSMVATLGVYVSAGFAIYLIQQPDWIKIIPFTAIVFLIVLAVIICLSCLYYIFRYLSKVRIIKRELESETEILHKLLNMVYEYKENIHDQKLSFVENAILEMKLQRIKFSSKW